MNNNYLLENFIENGSRTGPNEHKMKKANKGGSHQIELLVGTVFNEVCQLFETYQIQIQIPEQVSKIADKVQLFKFFIEQLLVNNNKGLQKQAINESGVISCKDCQNYEASLQKLEGEVRQHIRLEQQLKIFQDNQEEKLDQFKKQKKQFDKKLEQNKKQIQELKHANGVNLEKIGKLEAEIDQFKKENRDLKRNTSTNNQVLSTKRQTHKQSAFTYQSKQNKIDWVHRNISIKKDDKDKVYQRKSIQKRGDSGQKNWRNSNTKSNKMMSIMNEKLTHEKTKEQRKKAIQSKFQYRR